MTYSVHMQVFVQKVAIHIAEIGDSRLVEFVSPSQTRKRLNESFSQKWFNQLNFIAFLYEISQ